MEVEELDRRGFEESEDEEYGPAPKRQRRHKFKTFAQRVNNVDVDVYRSLGPKRAEPLAGSSSFFQERLTAWRELNAAHDWLEAVGELHNMCQTLPQLLHHQHDILNIILSRLTLDAALSLEPLLELLGALARDLQADFLPHMERVMTVLSNLVDAGVDREPELLQHVFTSCSLICKYLGKLLSADLGPILTYSARLRYHRARHVRLLAAQTFGFLLRHATPQLARSAVRTVLADAAVRPSVARLEGAGLLVAEAAAGVSNSLHSRGPALLALLLQQDILSASDFQGAKEGGTGGSSALKRKKDETEKSLITGGLSKGQLAARVAAVTAHCLDRLLNHIRRGPAALPLWEAVQGEVTARLDALQEAIHDNESPSVGELRWAAARGVALLSRMIEYHRGSRVETYSPLFAMATRLIGPEMLGNGNTGAESGEKSAQEGIAGAKEEDNEQQDGPEGLLSEFFEPSLSKEVLRYLQSLVYSHCKVISASEGPAAIERAAPLWAPAFSRAPQHEVLGFVRALITPPAGPEVSRCFTPQMFAAVGRSLLAGEETSLCWPLLMDLCSVLGGSLGSGTVPVILTAGAGIGSKLAKLVCSTVTSFKSGASEGDVAATWAALHCLPHAVAKPAQGAEHVQTLLASTSQVLDIAGKEGKVQGQDFQGLLMLHCAARAAVAAALESQQLPVGQDIVQEALALVQAHPSYYHAVHAAAETLQMARASGIALPASDLLKLAPLVAPNLGHPSSPLRIATLRLLCAFTQPTPNRAADGDSSDIPAPCDALPQLLAVHSRALGAEGGRPANVALGRVRTYLEFKKVPEELVPLVVRSLLGALHIRFAPLWPAADAALAMALDTYPSLAWPLIFEALTNAQTAFLGGDCYARPHTAEDQEISTGFGGAAPISGDLAERFVAAVEEGEAETAGGSTDAAARLTHVLRALASANNNTLEGKSKDWVPLFLSFSSAKSPDGVAVQGSEEIEEGGGDEEVEEEAAEEALESSNALSSVSARAWRSGLREWLAMLAGLKGIRGTYRGAALQRAVASHCLDIDPFVQQSALKCLKAFKLTWLAPYLDRLLRLADNKTLRTELAAFPLGIVPTSVRKGDDLESILPEHRAALVPLVVALLFPKMRKRSGRLGGKGAPGSARAAILNFLAAAEPAELRPLLELFLGPLGSVFVHPEGFEEESITPAETAVLGPGQGQWWGNILGTKSGVFWLEAIDGKALNSQPLRRRVGYLNTLEDLLKHLGHRMESFLPELLALTAVLLEGATAELLEGNKEKESEEEVEEKEEGGKEIRSRGLRLVAAVVERFPGSCDYSFLWPRLLGAAAPLMERIAVEAAADRPPPLVDICVALAASQKLVGVLADGEGGVAQEGEHPAALIACSAPWATEQHLGSRLLARCVGALSASTCAEPTRVAMLGALESIFDLVDPLPEALLGPHTPSLLAGLQAVVIAVWKYSGGKPQSKAKLLGVGQRGGSKPVAPPRRVTATRALAILELVGGRASDWGTASQLTDALLPLLASQGGGRGKRSADEELVARAMGALTALWSRLGSAAQAEGKEDALKEQEPRLRQIAGAVAPLAGSLSTRDARSALSAMLAAVAALLPELQPAAPLLEGLNAFSLTELDEPDYESRMSAYGKLTVATWSELTFLAAAPLVQHCARDLRNPDDLALRHAAAQALAELVDAAAAQSSANTGGDCVILVQRQLFPQMKRSVGASSLAVRQEHLSLVRRIALALPEVYPDLQPLTHKEAEADFWLNAAHLQLHRRARAFARLARMLRDPEAPSVAIGVFMGLLTPLLQQSIVEGRPEEDAAGHETKQIEVDRGANVVDAAVGALGAVAGVLPWVQYQQLLGQYLRLMARHSEGTASKAVLRAVCAVLDAFHFLPSSGEGDEGVEAMVEAEAPPAAELVGGEEGEEMVVVEGTEKSVLPDRAEVYRMLSKRVVPEFRGQLVSGENVRAPVAQALVKVLRLLPPALMRAELPRTLQTVANLLKLRLQRLRDDARTVLVAMATDLGPEYLPFTLEVLRSALPDRGYTAHVLGYTVHAVLEGVAPKAREEPGSIDDCLPMILPVIESDLFGAVSEAKEVDAFAASYKEAKRCRANDTFQLLASLVTFSTHVPRLLAPVRNRLHTASHPKIRSKLAVMLQYASVGLLANDTATSKDICELVFAISDAGLTAEETARDKATAASGAAVRSEPVQRGVDEAGDVRKALHQPLLVEFALTTFKAALKKGLVPTQGPEATTLLDPLLPILVRALKSRHSPSVTASLQALSILIIHSELPGLDKASTDAGKAVTDLLKRCPKTTHPVAQDCFKLLAGMMKRSENYSPSQSQLRFLLGWAFTDLEESAQRQTAFTLLRAILGRKLVLPEVYDLMERVQELMVRSQSQQVRQLASNSLLAFLLDYPLGPPRLQAHLQFLLTNLAYEHESGREAVLSMLSAVIIKFPEEVIAGWAETIFLPLVTRLVNDQSAKCRTAAGACARQLLQRLPAPRRDHLAKYCAQWLSGRDPRLVRASAQALGIIVEVEGAAVARRLPELLPAVSAVLRDRAALNDEAEEDEEHNNDGPGNSSSSAPGWQEAYYCLVLLEKVLGAAPQCLAWNVGAGAQGCWSAARALLLHRHAWVRKAAGRVIGAGLGEPSVGPAMLADGDSTLPGALALSFFRQIESNTADQDLAGQAVKCLVFLSLLMWEADEAAGRVPSWRAKKVNMDSNGEGAEVNGANGAEGNGHEGAEEQEQEEEEADKEEEEADENAASEAAAGSLTVHGLVRRMMRLADDKSYVRQLHRGAALRFIAALASRLGASKVEPYLPVLLRPLYRITEPGALGNTQEMKTLGDEVMGHLRSLMGADVLLAGYNAARDSVRRQRGERKRRAAVQTLVDPEAAAKRKIRAQERKKGGKRKALEEVRRMRSAGVVVKNKKAKTRDGRE